VNPSINLSRHILQSSFLQLLAQPRAQVSKRVLVLSSPDNGYFEGNTHAVARCFEKHSRQTTHSTNIRFANCHLKLFVEVCAWLPKKEARFELPACKVVFHKRVACPEEYVS
jgi:hypothetical protein